MVAVKLIQTGTIMIAQQIAAYTGTGSCLFEVVVAAFVFLQKHHQGDNTDAASGSEEPDEEADDVSSGQFAWMNRLILTAYHTGSALCELDKQLRKQTMSRLFMYDSATAI